ncbi:MAG: ParB/RepB/Spo0J family partition protein [Gemmataceae bacterium]
MPQQTTLPTATLRSDPGQPRKTRDPEKQRQLNESIALHGILQPLGVRADKITLVWGEGRLIGARAAGLIEVPVVILDKSLSEWQYQNLQLVENVVRSDLSQFELWQGCVRLMEANPAWGLKDMAKALSYDASAMTRIMSPSKCIPAVVDAFRDGKIVFGHTYAISKAETPEEQARLLSPALAGVSRAKIEAERVGRKNSNSGTPAVRVNKVKCLLPSGVTVVVSGEGVSLDESIEALAEAMREMKRARELGYTAKTFAAAMKDKARKG